MTVLMGNDPSPKLTLECATEFLKDIHDEKELAAFFAAVDNKAWWIANDVYDFEPDSEEYLQSKSVTDAWFSLSRRVKNRIFAVLLSEGIAIPKTGQIVVLEPFMKRNGFRNRNGWWIQEP